MRSEVIMTEPKWRARSRSEESKKDENQQSAFWDVISTHNKRMLVIVNYRL